MLTWHYLCATPYRHYILYSHLWRSRTCCKIQPIFFSKPFLKESVMELKINDATRAITSGGFGGSSQIGGRQKCFHLLKNQRLSPTKEVFFRRSKSGYFCWSNYAILQGITTVWKRFVSLIQKTFETGPKQWASFFTSYTDIVYLQNVFKSMLRASVCQCFGYPQRNQWRTVSATHSRSG